MYMCCATFSHGFQTCSAAFIEACRALNIFEESDGDDDGASAELEEANVADANVSAVSEGLGSNEMSEHIISDVIDDEGDVDVFPKKNEEDESKDE